MCRNVAFGLQIEILEEIGKLVDWKGSWVYLRSSKRMYEPSLALDGYCMDLNRWYLSVRLMSSIGSSSKPSGKPPGEATSSGICSIAGASLLELSLSKMSCEGTSPAWGSVIGLRSSFVNVLARVLVGVGFCDGSYLENDLEVFKVCGLPFSTAAISAIKANVPKEAASTALHDGFESRVNRE